MQRPTNLFNVLPKNEKAWIRNPLFSDLQLQPETALLTGAEVTLLPTFKLTCTDEKFITEDRPSPHYVYSKDRVIWAKSILPIYAVKFADGFECFTFAPLVDVTTLLHYQGFELLHSSPQFFLPNEDRAKLAISISACSAFLRTELLHQLMLAGAQFTMLYHGANYLTKQECVTPLHDLPNFMLIAEAKNHHFGAMTVLMYFDAAHIANLITVLQQHEPSPQLKTIPPFEISRGGFVLISHPDALNCIIQEGFIDFFHAEKQYEKLCLLLNILTMSNDQAAFIDEFIELDFINPVYPIRLNSELIMLCVQLTDVFRDLQLIKSPQHSMLSEKEMLALFTLCKSIEALQAQLKYYNPVDFLGILFPIEQTVIKIGYNLIQANSTLPRISAHRNALYQHAPLKQEKDKDTQAKPAPH